jgi:hypothetical protein
VEAIGYRVAPRTDDLEILDASEPRRELRRRCVWTGDLDWAGWDEGSHPHVRSEGSREARVVALRERRDERFAAVSS